MQVLCNIQNKIVCVCVCVCALEIMCGANNVLSSQCHILKECMCPGDSYSDREGLQTLIWKMIDLLDKLHADRKGCRV